MLKFYITGGDNCYCPRCGGLCDRYVLCVDTEAKTLECVSNGFCLGKRCGDWHCLTGSLEGWSLHREFAVSKAGHSVERWMVVDKDGQEVAKAVVKGNKWGKDGEFGEYGTLFLSTDGKLHKWASKEAYAKFWSGEIMSQEEMFVESGWKVKGA